MSVNSSLNIAIEQYSEISSTSSSSYHQIAKRRANQDFGRFPSNSFQGGFVLTDPLLTRTFSQAIGAMGLRDIGFFFFATLYVVFTVFQIKLLAVVVIAVPLYNHLTRHQLM